MPRTKQIRSQLVELCIHLEFSKRSPSLHIASSLSLPVQDNRKWLKFWQICSRLLSFKVTFIWSLKSAKLCLFMLSSIFWMWRGLFLSRGILSPSPKNKTAQVARLVSSNARTGVSSSWCDLLSELQISNTSIGKAGNFPNMEKFHSVQSVASNHERSATWALTGNLTTGKIDGEKTD